MTTLYEAGQFIYNHPEIHQTGSRYWNLIDPKKVPITADTDHDFVAQYSDDIVRKLIELGFRTRNPKLEEKLLTKQEDYEREGTVIVYYFNLLQVILKANLTCYLQVQNTVGVDFYVNYLWKKNRTATKIQDTLNFLYELNK